MLNLSFRNERTTANTFCNRTIDTGMWNGLRYAGRRPAVKVAVGPRLEAAAVSEWFCARTTYGILSDHADRVSFKVKVLSILYSIGKRAGEPSEVDDHCYPWTFTTLEETSALPARRNRTSIRLMERVRREWVTGTLTRW
ncbi:hypothetical protein EVAR_8502_1 [Eumeta japonica]|uniref:Uncharacterized protein n=1 Tax=Eumeta variegata TaxID=151549 RepID=A0A4C1TXD6_EUMVA|nr:hypothetical protein EVAR_8502_1 [Eumeta japonica]